MSLLFKIVSIKVIINSSMILKQLGRVMKRKMSIGLFFGNGFKLT